MVQTKEIERLRKEIALERSKVKKIRDLSDSRAQQVQVKRDLRRELFLLRNPRKVMFARRFAKGIAKTSKIVARGVKTQVGLIRQQQERDERLQRARSTRRPKVKVRKIKRRPSDDDNGGGFFTPLDF